MGISADISKKLTHVVLASAGDHASAGGPLTVYDRDANWLVVGPALTNESPGIASRTFYIFLQKIDAEVTGIGYCIEFDTEDKVEASWRLHARPFAFAAWEHRPEVTPSAETLDLYATLHGGLVNQPDNAVAYAAVLLGLSDTHRRNLIAVDDRGVWKIAADDKSVLDFSRHNGRISFMSR